MGTFNLSDDELEAIKSLDEEELKLLIRQCLDDERTSRLLNERLDRLGPFVSQCHREFEAAVADSAKAKAKQKRDRTWSIASEAGGKLESAVSQMKQWAQTHEQERKLFFVDDMITPPHLFKSQLEVRVSYRWRESPEDEWTYGNILFSHLVDTRPDPLTPLPKRKPSAAKQNAELQDALWRDWERLRDLGLYSVREFLREGGRPDGIPKAFTAKTDGYRGALNNFSCRFWVT